MEWMCAECGAPHPKNNPPCKNCGAMQFEKTVVRKRPEDETKPRSIEWECTECGRTHPKNNPPCSRCGNMQLESVEINQFDDDELSSGLGARDVAKYVGALVVVGLLVFAGFNSGILTQSETPTVENVPGEANRSSGLELSAVEYQIYDAINEERSAEGREELSLNPETAGVADYYNKLMVKRGEYPLDRPSEDVFEPFSCSPSLTYNRLGYESETDGRAIDYYDTESKLAGTLSDSWLADAEIRQMLLEGQPSGIGVDVHVAENGNVYATVALC